MSSNGVDARALGLAVGTLWGVAVVLLGLASRTGWGEEWRNLLADVYIGYDGTPTGLAIGAAWGFVDGLVGGFALGRLYDRFSRR